MLYTLLSAVGLSYIYTFITAAPCILISHFQVPEHQFGYYQAVIVAAYFFGSLTATRLVDSWGSTRVLNFGLGSCLLGAMLLVAVIFSNLLSPYTLVAGNVLIAFGIGPIFAVSPSRAMSAVVKSVGSAAAVFGSLEVGLSGIVAAMVSVYHDGTARPYGIIIGLTAVCMIL
ncbi:MAG: multidrug effflux MFS transporter, partial [Aestuariibacter sp.]|nr:multidrug effflux MFS transporter [Aestuariibacter sp.]